MCEREEVTVYRQSESYGPSILMRCNENLRVAYGGMTGGAPRAPYAYIATEVSWEQPRGLSGSFRNVRSRKLWLIPLSRPVTF